MTQRLLVDSHMLLALVVAEPNRSVRPPMPWSSDDLLFASAASLWEITIKVRLGKLDLDMQVEELPGYLEQVGFDLLPVTPPHAVYRALPEPPTRDPFDRLLLAQCAIENLRLVTLDRALVDHPLAYKPA